MFRSGPDSSRSPWSSTCTPGPIVGWETSTAKDTAFVEHCLRMALWRRENAGRPVAQGLIHHSDAGSQYTSIRYTDTLMLEGLTPSIGSVGDAYDNAAAETVMGLFKNEAVATGSPFRTGALKTEADVIEVVFEWVHWYNNQRLHFLPRAPNTRGIRAGILCSRNRLVTRRRRQQTGGMIPGTVHTAVAAILAASNRLGRPRNPRLRGRGCT